VQVNTTTTFKFIISSVPFTSLWTHDAQIDSWAAYLDERDALLTVLGTVPNVFVLSGDRHEFAAIEFLGGKVVEFSTSPFSMSVLPQASLFAVVFE
jgi:alkaline phosphatase D